MILFNKTKEFLKEAKRRNHLLFNLSLVLAFLFLLFIASFWVCGNPPVADICYWLKPFKFSISFALYVFTLSWLMEYIRPIMGEKRLRQISLLIVFLVVIEMVIMLLQSIRYTTLLASLQLPEIFFTALRLTGEAAIITTSALVLYVAIHFFRKVPLTPQSYLFSIRAGFTIFISSCFLGLFLLLFYGQVPPDQTSLGLPFTQFGNPRENLISLHFFGIHALQFLPLLGFYLKKEVATPLIFSLLLGYLAATSLLLINAL